MKRLRAIVLGTSLFAGSLVAQDFNFSLGPFSMQFNVDGSYYAHDHKDILDSPLCYAISNQKQLDLVVESKEKIDSKEMKFVTKRLVIEPYAFGMTRDGKPVVQGNVVKETLLKEVTVKFGEEQKEDASSWSGKKEGGFFSGLFKSNHTQTIEIQKISNLYVISDSHFDLPKNYEGFKDDTIQVICQIPVSN